MHGQHADEDVELVEKGENFGGGGAPVDDGWVGSLFNALIVRRLFVHRQIFCCTVVLFKSKRDC